jgi:hypothetical protein
MQLEKVTSALRLAHKAGLDGVDLLVLAEILAKQAQGGEVTIMKISLGKGVASFGTIHARVQRLIRKGYLTKRVSTINQRYKPIEQGPKLVKFLSLLEDLI